MHKRGDAGKKISSRKVEYVGGSVSKMTLAAAKFLKIRDYECYGDAGRKI